MQRLIGFGLAVLVNVLFVGALVRASTPLPEGEVLITELANGTSITAHQDHWVRSADRSQAAAMRTAKGHY
jgi:hypothetical protein